MIYRKLRAVKSEFNSRTVKKKFKVDRNRTRTPLRFSRRLRQLPPEDVSYFDKVRDRLKREKLDAKCIISRESSTQIKPRYRSPKRRKLHYPQRPKNSKELISILSAPKICNKKQSNAKKVVEVPMRVRGGSCRPKTVVKSQNVPMHNHFTLIKNIKKEKTDVEKVIEKRKRFVLEVLNRGEIKDIEKLHSVGCKTAERIILYRQIMGPISKISELSKMPKFPRKRLNDFIAKNFLKAD